MASYRAEMILCKIYFKVHVVSGSKSKAASSDCKTHDVFSSQNERKLNFCVDKNSKLGQSGLRSSAEQSIQMIRLLPTTLFYSHSHFLIQL